MEEPTHGVDADAQSGQLLGHGSHESYSFQRAVYVAGDHLAWESVIDDIVFFGRSERCDDGSALLLVEDHLGAFLKYSWKRGRGRKSEKYKGAGVERQSECGEEGGEGCFAWC